jgi:uncharacterized protein (TIGR02246 family)
MRDKSLVLFAVCMVVVDIGTLHAQQQVPRQVPAAGSQKAPAATPPASNTKPAESTPAPSATPPGMDRDAEEAAIRANADKYVEAYNRRDSRTMASMWSPEAVYMDPHTGEGVVGRDAIAKQFDYAFAGSEDAKLEVDIDSIDFLSPNVAIEKGRAIVKYSDHPDEVTDYTAVHVKRDGVWMLDRVSEVEVPPPPPSHYEQLKELEWMVGSWIDDNEGTLIETDCEWTKNQNFLTRSFKLVVGDQINMSGMQIIGWDPANKQIRSWVFDSDGGFSQGTWSRKDNRWFIKQVGTLPDGAQSTATNIITKIDDDSFTWQSTDRTVDDEMLPNVDEVLVKRAAAQDATD